MAEPAPAERGLELRVVSPSATIFEGPVSSVVVPAWDGKVGILPGHAPFVSLLGAGPLDYRDVGGTPGRLFVRQGVVKVESHRVIVLSEYASAAVPDDFSPGQATLFPDEISEA